MYKLKNIFYKNRLLLILWSITICAVFLVFKSSDDEFISIFNYKWIHILFSRFATGNSIIFNLSLAFISSIIFYMLVIWLPDIKRRSIIKTNLHKQYLYFKQEIIDILLTSCNEHDYKLVNKLCQQENFVAYFGGKHNKKWQLACNQLKQQLLIRLLTELQIFRDEVVFILNNIVIDDENTYSFLKRFSQIVYRKNYMSAEYEDIKQLSGFLYELLAGYSLNDKARKKDFIEEVIKKI